MKNKKKEDKLFIAIVVLTFLLVLTSTALAGVVIYKYTKANKNIPVTVPNNVITEQEQAALDIQPKNYVIKPVFSGMLTSAPIIVDKAESEPVTLKIYRNHAVDSTPFQATNLFPGDTESKSYAVQVSYKGSVTVHFHIDIKEGFEKLAEVLQCRVQLRNGALLYEGLMKDMPSSVDHILPQSEGTTTELIYDMDVYLDTSVGNEYQNKRLEADFRWWVAVEEDSETTETTETTESTESTESTETTESTESSESPETSESEEESEESSETEDKPTGGELIKPTGDKTNLFVWCGLAGISMVLILLLIIGRNKKEDKQNE